MAGLDTSRLGNAVLQETVNRLAQRVQELEATSAVLLQEAEVLRTMVKAMASGSKDKNVLKLHAELFKQVEAEAEANDPGEEDAPEAKE